jgi:NAD(P)H dehydrogenase (quinone)
MMLITGATGTTGRETVQQLSVAGAQVRALVRRAETASAVKGVGVELVIGDLK